MEENKITTIPEELERHLHLVYLESLVETILEGIDPDPEQLVGYCIESTTSWLIEQTDGAHVIDPGVTADNLMDTIAKECNLTTADIDRTGLHSFIFYLPHSRWGLFRVTRQRWTEETLLRLCYSYFRSWEFVPTDRTPEMLWRIDSWVPDLRGRVIPGILLEAKRRAIITLIRKTASEARKGKK